MLQLSNNTFSVNKKDPLQFAHQDQHNLMPHSTRLSCWNKMRGPTEYFTPFENHATDINKSKQQLYEMTPEQVKQQTKSDYVPIQL